MYGGKKTNQPEKNSTHFGPTPNPPPPPPLPSPSSQQSFPLAICTYGLEFSSLCVAVISDLFFHAGNHSRDQRRTSHHRWHRAYRSSPGVFLIHINSRSEHCNHRNLWDTVLVSW